MKEITDVFTPFVTALFGKEGNSRVVNEVGFVKLYHAFLAVAYAT